MADNYLEKRYEEVFSSSKPSVPTVKRLPLDRLLLKNRSYRGYDRNYKVHPLQMKAIVDVNTRIASGSNAQTLRFHMVTEGPEADKVLGAIHLGGALPELHLPFPGTEPEAFIVVCSTAGENPIVDIDLGISLQSMLLKAVDLGLGGIIVRNFDRNALQQTLGLPLVPLAVLAIGKPSEKIELVPVRAGDNLKYYRKDGTHFVPKIVVEDLLV